MRKIALGLAAVFGAYALLALVLAVWFPPPLPGDELAPRVGDVLVSETEGARQTILATDGDFFRTELVLLPNKPGPPLLHYHETFEETFAVAAGTLHIDLDDGRAITVGPGEVFRATPGVRHRPSNRTQQPVILRGSEVRIPRRFALCLSQLYAFMDAPENRGPRQLLQLALMRGYCDVHFAGVPRALEPMIAAALAPIGRAVGLKSFYPPPAAAVARP
jgi:mannose-6-phosphate isomerase-like protein (cupin superfamily)